MKDNVDNYNRQLRQLHYVKKMDCSLPKLKTISVNCNVNSCQFMSIRGGVLFLAHKNATCCISDPKQKLVDSGGRDWANWSNWDNWWE